ncbi:hypothetical protein ACT3CE_09895 [Marinifilum sp. RC60d5]|uniref:hypothetical protein n=1 Tax=Marinifilum sp. RC60d5 TaxID=3458414 RepID=UPI0040350C67
MDISLVTQYSLWYLLPFTLLAFGLVYWQYFFRKPYHNNLSVSQILTLGSLRFLALFLLLILLIAPQLKYKKRIENKPALIFAQDNSSSLRLGKDSSYYLNQYPKDIITLLSTLENRYDIQYLKFGKQVEQLDSFKFDYSYTDFSELMTYLKNNYGNRENVQVLLASDGLYNVGGNPRYLAKELSLPVHTLQLGDTSIVNDISLFSVKSNRIGFTNSRLPVRIGIKANNAKGSKLQILIIRGNKVLVKDNLIVNQESFYAEKDYMIIPEYKGLQRFTTEVKSNVKEYSLKNNSADFVVDVLDSKRKIAICFDQYHPDISALKSAIDNNSNFSSELINLSKQTANLRDVNLCVMYQIPSKSESYPGLFQQVKREKIPLLMVVGGNTNLLELNKLDIGLQFSNKDGLFRDAVYSENDVFSLFQTQSSNKEFFTKLPPLLVPFGDYTFGVENYTLAYQKVKGIETSYPLISFSNIQDQKISWIFGEGIWRWKLYEYQMNDTHQHFNELVNRIMQYQALKVKKNQLVIKHEKDFIEGNNILINAELYNESYQISNAADLKFELSDSDSNTYDYTFNRQDGAYQLSLNFLKKGEYKYWVKTIGLEKNLERKGQFVVRSNSLESKTLQANKDVLVQISEKSNGQYFTLSGLKDLKQFLLSGEKTKTTISSEVRYGNAVDLLYLLSFIIILMILEWFLKKYWLGN